MRARFRFLICSTGLLILVGSKTQAAATTPMRWNYYGEAYYLSGPAIAGQNNRLQISATSLFLQPVLAAGNDVMTFPNRLNELQNYSYYYVAPGLRWVHPFGALGYESRLYSQFTEQGQGIDHRFYLTFADVWLTSGKFARSGIWFVENYGELVYSTRAKYNLIFSGFARPGYRLLYQETFTTDLFLEGFVTKDRIGEYYYNLFELRPTLRIQTILASIRASLQASIIRPHYFDDYENDAPKNRQGWSTKFLAVLARSF